MCRCWLMEDCFESGAEVLHPLPQLFTLGGKAGNVLVQLPLTLKG